MKKFLTGKVIIGVLCFFLFSGSVFIVADGIPAWIYDIAYCADKCQLYEGNIPKLAACMNGCDFALDN